MAEVEDLINRKAVPLVMSHLSDERLLALWDENVGGFEYPMLKGKSILLAERGEFSQLPAIFQRIRETCRGAWSRAPYCQGETILWAPTSVKSACFILSKHL